MLIPLLPSASIDEVVSQVRAAHQSDVELLVPNNMKALQSAAGCTILKRTVADSGARVTLFTNDDRTQRAAQNAGLNVIAVDGAIVGPSKPLGPSTQHHTASWPSPQATSTPRPQVQATHALPNPSAPAAASLAAPATAPAVPAPSTAVAPAVPAPNPVIETGDDAFLADLQAFEQTLAPAPRANAQTWNSDEGAAMFDGERGIGHTPDDPWALALGDIDTTIAEEPAQPVHTERGRSGTPRRGTRTSAPKGGPQPQQPPAGQNRASSFGSTLASVFPRRRGGDNGGTPPPAQSTPKNAAPSRGFGPWIMVALAGVLLVIALLFSYGLFPSFRTSPVLEVYPAAPPSEQQTYTDLVLPVGDAAPQEGVPQVQAAVIVQPVRVEVRGQASQTAIAPIGRASGTLFLRNTLSQPVLVRAGTVVPASNGVQFTVDNDVTVGASVATADGITFGRGDVTVTANVPGGAGNIGPGAIGSIPGYEGTLRVEQGAFSGGSDQEVRIVRAEDVNQVLPDALSRLYGSGTQSLQLAATGRTGFTLMTETVSPTLETLQQLQGVEYGVFPPIGSVTSDGSFLLEMRATFNGVAEPTNRPLASQLDAAARALLVADSRAAPDARVQVTQWSFGQQGVVVSAAVQAAGSTPTLDQALADEVQRAIAGKPRQEAIDYLNSLQEAGRIASWVRLQEGWETIPEDVQVVQAGS